MEQRSQILFLQRQYNEKDFNSGQICLPGGHVDGDENDFEAVLREIKEETGMELTPQNSNYIGKYDKNFFVRMRPDRSSLYLNVHVFFLLQDLPIVVQESEIRDYRWVDLQIFLKAEEQRLRITRQFKTAIKAKSFPFFLRGQAQRFLDNLELTENGSFDIDMDQRLWGLTLFIILYLLKIMKNQYHKKVYTENIEKLTAHA